jgi:hypothetical protein
VGGGDVEPQPTAEGLAAFAVGAIQPPVGPFIQQGLVEPFHLAIGLGPEWAGAPQLDLQSSGGLLEHLGVGIGLGVVGEDPLDAHAVVGEEAGPLDQE